MAEVAERSIPIPPRHGLNSPNPVGSPRLVLRFSDIRSGLNRTSISASFSEPNSPTGLCLNNITKTLCTPSPRIRPIRNAMTDIAPKSETRRRVDLGTPCFKSRSFNDEPRLPVFTNLTLRESDAKKVNKIGRCLALSFQDQDTSGINSSQESIFSIGGNSPCRSKRKDRHDSGSSTSSKENFGGEVDGDFKRPAPPLDRAHSTPRKIHRSDMMLLQYPESPLSYEKAQSTPKKAASRSENQMKSVPSPLSSSEEGDFDPDCFICAQITGTKKQQQQQQQQQHQQHNVQEHQQQQHDLQQQQQQQQKPKEQDCDFCFSNNNTHFFSPIKQEAMSPRPQKSAFEIQPYAPKLPVFPPHPMSLQHSDSFYPFYYPADSTTTPTTTSTPITIKDSPPPATTSTTTTVPSKSFSFDPRRLPCLFCVSEIAPLSSSPLHPSMNRPTCPQKMEGREGRRNGSCSCPTYCN